MSAVELLEKTGETRAENAVKTAPRWRTALSVLKRKRFWAAMTAIPASLLTWAAAGRPELTERLYSSGIYPALSAAFGRLTGAVPFSLAEFTVILAPLVFIAYIIACVLRKNIAGAALSLLCAAGLLLFLFTALCGLNYHRRSFADISGLDVRPSSPVELKSLCAELVERANRFSALVSRDSDGVMISSFADYSSAAKFASGAYAAAGESFPALAGFCPRPKPVLASKAMSAAGLVGIYFPFTFEANVNTDVPDYIIPSSMLHELAHFKGFMREDEANFIAYLACVSCGSDDFAYSGTVLALVHSINALYSSDIDAYWEVVGELDGAVLRDLRANTEYWQRFEGPVTEASEKINDAYLKTNRQPEGVKSYGRMVDLLLAYNRLDRPSDL